MEVAGDREGSARRGRCDGREGLARRGGCDDREGSACRGRGGSARS